MIVQSPHTYDVVRGKRLARGMTLFGVIIGIALHLQSGQSWRYLPFLVAISIPVNYWLWRALDYVAFRVARRMRTAGSRRGEPL